LTQINDLRFAHIPIPIAIVKNQSIDQIFLSALEDRCE
jgi:hypothetical protein